MRTIIKMPFFGKNVRLCIAKQIMHLDKAVEVRSQKPTKR